MKKHVLSCLFLILFLTGCAQQTQNITEKQDEVRIGLLVTLSGPAAIHGEHVLLGAQKAVDKLNEEGANIKLLVQDNQNDPTIALSAYRLLESQKPDIIFTTMSGASAAIIPLAKESGIPIITSLTYADFQEYENVYQYFQTTDDLTRIAIEFFQEKGIKRIALLSSNIEAGHALMNVAKNGFETAGIKIGGEEYYDPKVSDHRTQILKLTKQNPDAIYVFDLRPDQIVTQIKDQYDGVIVFTDTPVATNLYRLPEMNGTYAASQQYMIFGTTQNAKFLDLFRGEDPNAEAGMGYDVINLIHQKFKKGNWPASVTGTFEGLSGTIELDSSRKPSIPIQMVRIENGKLEGIE